MDHQKSSANLNWGPCTTIWDLLMQGVISRTTVCLLFINMAFILASHLKSIAELQFLIKDFERLKIFIVLVFAKLECGDSLCRHFVVLFIYIYIKFAITFFLIFIMSWQIQNPEGQILLINRALSLTCKSCLWVWVLSSGGFCHLVHNMQKIWKLCTSNIPYV